MVKSWWRIIHTTVVWYFGGWGVARTRIAMVVNHISILLTDHFSSFDMTYKVDMTLKRNHLLSSPDFTAAFKKRRIFLSPFFRQLFYWERVCVCVCVCMPASMRVFVSLCVCVCIGEGEGGLKIVCPHYSMILQRTLKTGLYNVTYLIQPVGNQSLAPPLSPITPKQTNKQTRQMPKLQSKVNTKQPKHPRSETADPELISLEHVGASVRKKYPISHMGQGVKRERKQLK